MVQMHLLYHYLSNDDGATYYEANMHAAYYLIRSGKILKAVEQRLGEYPAKVMSTIMYCGHAQVGYLESLPELRIDTVHKPSTNGNGVNHLEENGLEENGLGENGLEENGLEENGENNDDELPPSTDGANVNGDHDTHNGRLHATLKSLAGHGYICRMRESHFQSLADHILDAERIAQQAVKTSDVKGKTAAELLKGKREQVLLERTDNSIGGVFLVHGIPKGIKRPQTNGISEGSNKRRRVDSSDGPEEEPEDEEDYDDDDDEPMNVSHLEFF
jgi:DNA-directed RNA polymerase III subunit RPC3